MHNPGASKHIFMIVWFQNISYVTQRTFEYHLVWDNLRNTVFFLSFAFKIRDGAPNFFLKNSVSQDMMYCFTNFTCSLTLHGPFLTIAPCIRINMHNWWPSWKSIWLTSPCFDLRLTALLQTISFVTEMNFLFPLVLEIWEEGGHFEI